MLQLQGLSQRRTMTPVRSMLLLPVLLSLFTGTAAAPTPPHAGAGEPPIRLVINIPAGRLDVFERGQRTRSYLVSVGRRGYETPAGSYYINRIEWNPWFHPPKSNWARNWKIAPPGPDNPMGRVKLQFSTLLYLHGTSEEEEARLGARASHGCVRMGEQDIRELARLIHRYSTPGVSAKVLDELAEPGAKNRSFPLPRGVPLSVTYNIVEVRDGQIVINPDVYRRKGDSIKPQLTAALQKLGVSPGQLDPQRLEELSRTRRATRVTISLDTLVANVGNPR
jgi:L,D-transpeptidase ErfK/SrfK